jgi:hypothetical protein
MLGASMGSPVQCANCGAMMNPEWDGRVYKCPYCKTMQQVAIGADQIAAGMQIDFANIDAFLMKLATTLHQGFRERTAIQASGTYVHAIEVNLDPHVFTVHREGARAIASQKKVVRGIALKTKQLAIDVWFDQLTRALAEHANENARAAWVLQQLGKKRDDG